MQKLDKGSKKLLNAWAFFDWANSAYTLTIASTIFPLFYASLFVGSVARIQAFGFEMKSTALISFVTAFAFLVIAFMSPLLSGVADYIGNKKTFMKFFCYLGSFGCIGLYWFSLEHIYISMLFYFFGLIGYWGSLVFYNSYLPDIAFPEQQDKISAKGFAIGYSGSVLLLLINLAMIIYPNFFNIQGEESVATMKAMRYSFVSVGIWWLLFSQYTFYYLPKGVSQGHKVTNSVLLNGYKELNGVWNELKSSIKLKRFLNAFFVYSMAVQTIMLMAVYFGEEEINWANQNQKTIGLIISILLIQIVGIIGAFVTSRASERFGNIVTLIAINFIWMFVCFYAFFIETPFHFYIVGSIVGFVMGGVQALSRSTYSKFLPKTEDTTSYFSFYDVTEKIGIVLGMVIYGVVDQITGTMRNAILFLFVFFLFGIFLLFKVPQNRIKS
ncbi:MFS transporter [Yeosuana sp. MJ-SS3]|uniref:MFS transporter n=1 Tax=Gilvirhabdus luticola TaxID=3079858 RepID=A0ABU3UAC3_9FLAO|nr:MFS transporter [Yeosuana sp. MJ-SS3]MDU8887261.1 MFS transporter [Yeosuana sp. MJ-SS3]